MKKFAISLLTVCLLMAFNPFASTASTIAPKAVATEMPGTPPGTQALKDRFLEIKKMDKSNLSGSERKALRHEKREIKRTLNKAGISNGGIYLSAGAIILIVILIIVLL